MASDFPEWHRLEVLHDLIAEGGIAVLDADEIVEFGRLYRRAAHELSYARLHETDPARIAYLNGLLGRCYPYVYAAPRRALPSFWRFLSADFPVALRRHLHWVVLATLLSLIPAAIGFPLTLHRPSLAAQVLPRELVEDTTQSERHNTAVDWLPSGVRPTAAGFIMMNNIRVSLIAFAGGMTAGVLTALILISNGLMLGVIAAVVARDGPLTALNFWSFVAPHGVLELTAIFISGGAGFLLAWAIVSPGRVPRAVALRRAGSEAGKLMLGVAVMLVVAGLIEGFFSPIPPDRLPPDFKLIVAAAEAGLMVSYFALAGPRAAPVPVASTAPFTAPTTN